MVNTYRRALLGIGLFLTLLGCEGFFVFGDFPTYLSLVKNYGDLDRLLRAHVLTGFLPVAASLPSKSERVLVFLQRDGWSGYLGIDRRDFTNSYWVSGSMSSHVVETVKGLASGSQQWADPSGLLFPQNTAHYFHCAPSYAPAGELTHNFVQDDYNYVMEYTFDTSFNSFNFLLSQYWMNIVSSPNAQTSLSLPMDAEPFHPLLGFVSSHFRPLQAIRWSHDQVALLVHSDISHKGMVRLLDLDLAMGNAPALGAVLKHGFPTRNQDGERRYTWLTKRGVVTYTQDLGSGRLTLYSFGELSSGGDTAELRIPLNLQPLGFHESGTEWVAYDDKTRKLFLLRTWW